MAKYKVHQTLLPTQEIRETEMVHHRRERRTVHRITKRKGAKKLSYVHRFFTKLLKPRMLLYKERSETIRIIILAHNHIYQFGFLQIHVLD